MQPQPHLEIPEVAKYESQFHESGFYSQEIITLTAGAPRLELLRMLPPIIETATRHRMEKELQGNVQLFQYGAEEGNWDYRSLMAKFLSEEYGDRVKSEQIFLTGGASCGLWLFLSVFGKAGTIVFVEDPTYFYGLKFLKDAEVIPVPIKTDEHGIIVEEFHSKLKEHFSVNPAPCFPPLRALMYLIPTFQNPTGSVLQEDRCRKIVSLCRKYGITVICDDVYNLLHYGGSAHGPKRLFAFDNQSEPDYSGNVISNGTFSKFLGPGLRIGWMEAPNWVVMCLKNSGFVGSGGGINTYTSGLLCSLLELGLLKKHLHFVRESFKSSMETIVELLRKQLPEGCRVQSKGMGGYFIWIELPKEINAEDLLLFCSKYYCISFLPGQRASLSGSFPNYIRVCVCFQPIDTLTLAVEKLCQAISVYQSQSDSS